VSVEVKYTFTLSSGTCPSKYFSTLQLFVLTLPLGDNIEMPPPLTFQPNRPLKWHSCKVVTFLTCLAAVILLLLYFPTRPYSPTLPILQTIPWRSTRHPSDTRIAKATITYAPSSNNRSLALHAAYNAAFGYPMHVLRTPIVRGFANTLLWLQHLIVSEMLKNVEERVEWIMYVFIPFSLLPYRVSCCLGLSLRFLELI
jgi:hypothetical protein